MIRWFILLLGVLAACGGTATSTEDPAAVEQLYTCGMHPEVVQSGPGTCPICGMDLTPMTRGSGGVQIAPGVMQQMGVQTEPVKRTTVFRHLRTIGEVDVGEDEMSVVNLRFSGWVERLRVESTGDEVKRGQTLFDVYAPDVVAAQQELLLAVQSGGAESRLAKAARRKLELWDIATYDIDQILETGEVSRTVPVRAPSAGFVLHKDIVEGARVTAGKDLYRIGNLQRIWVTAEVYEHDAPWVDVGQPAQLELTHLAGQVVEGQVAYVYPTLNEKSRTLPVRLEFDNPGVRLKPGMFATVYIQYRRMDDVIAVPTAAILHSGRRKLVFVGHGQGRFEPREVTIGLQGDHRLTEITSGLSEGDVVVTSGQFLIDSESQLQEALRKILAGAPPEVAHDHDHIWSCPMHPEVVQQGPGSCPECGMALEERPATEAETEAHENSAAQAGQYTCPMHPEVVSDEPGRCPDCGMFLELVE